MGWIFLLLYFTAFYFYKIRDFFNPGMITCLSWCVVLIAYHLLNHPLYSLSSIFYPTIFFWCVAFVFGTEISSSKRYKISKYVHPSNQISNQLLYLIVFFMLAFSVLMTFYEAHTMGLGVVGLTRNVNLSEKLVLPISLKIVLFFSSVLTPVVLLVLIEKFSRYKKAIVIVLFMLLIVLSGSKSSVFGFFSAIIFLLFYKKRIKLLTIVFMAFCALLLMIVITLFRDKNAETDFFKIVYIYFLSPLTAFDYLLQGRIVPNETPVASTVLGLIYRIFNKMGVCQIPSANLGFIFVPLPTNVYTLLLTGYLDFGYYGMFVFSFFYGVIWGWLYSFVRQNFLFAKLLYASFYFVLIFQFFADFVFPYLVIFIYQILFSLLFFVRIKRPYMFRLSNKRTA